MTTQPDITPPKENCGERLYASALAYQEIKKQRLVDYAAEKAAKELSECRPPTISKHASNKPSRTPEDIVQDSNAWIKKRERWLQMQRDLRDQQVEETCAKGASPALSKGTEVILGKMAQRGVDHRSLRQKAKEDYYDLSSGVTFQPCINLKSQRLKTGGDFVSRLTADAAGKPKVSASPPQPEYAVKKRDEAQREQYFTDLEKRSKEAARKKEKRIAHEQKAQMDGVTFHPHVDPKSMKMTEGRTKMKVTEVVPKKVVADASPSPNRKKLTHEDHEAFLRRSSDFLRKKEKNLKLHEKQLLSQEAEVMQECTFQPEISAETKRIFSHTKYLFVGDTTHVPDIQEGRRPVTLSKNVSQERNANVFYASDIVQLPRPAPVTTDYQPNNELRSAGVEVDDIDHRIASITNAVPPMPYHCDHPSELPLGVEVDDIDLSDIDRRIASITNAIQTWKQSETLS